VPVVAPMLALGDDIVVLDVAQAIHSAMERSPVDEEAPIALAIPWKGDPLYKRLRALAEGIALSLTPRVSLSPFAPLVLMIDGDVGRTLGHILEHEIGIGRHVVSIDGIQLKEFDFVDIGEVIRPADVVPVVIKSLLFSGAATAGATHEATTYLPIRKSRRAAQ
jgi:ethanolamine utilization protein EutA